MTEKKKQTFNYYYFTYPSKTPELQTVREMQSWLLQVASVFNELSATKHM